MRRPLSSKAPAVTWRGAGSPGRADGREGEAGDLVLGGGQTDHVESIGNRPEHVGRIAAEQRREGGIIAGCGEPVGKNGDRRTGKLVEGGGDAGIDRLPVDRHRARFGDVELVESGGSVEGTDVGVGLLGGEGEDDGRACRIGIGDQPFGGSDATVPVACTGPAIVDDEGERGAAGRQPLTRIPDRFGECKHDQRRHDEAKQRQPPWALMRRFLLAHHARQDLQRRKDFHLRLGRGQPQQPPDDGQSEQAPQDGRKAEAERQPAHRRTPAA